MPCIVRHEGNVAVLQLEGKLALGPGVDDFRRAWSEALGSGCRNLVVNLTQVPIIDSSGIGTLIRFHSAAVASHGRVRLVAPTEFVRKALELSQLHTIFKIYDDETAAVSSFDSGAGAAPARR